MGTVGKRSSAAAAAVLVGALAAYALSDHLPGTGADHLPGRA
jgi:hypothetical protein